MTKRTAHIISHSHWDREWYLPYEKHHVRLVRLMDTLLDTLERDPDYRSFYLDGQTIILEDYLQVRPEQRGRLESFIKQGRIHIGPWYILQDAFLTSSEANVRNMQIGHRDAAQYGVVSKVGYFPDTFGNMGQAPQMMKQAGIDNAVFGRGVKPTGFNNLVSDSAYESSFSELIWEGPDGSQVLGILFANWYSNGNEVPSDKAEARGYWDRKLADAEKYASTSELLYMNGCDHQPIQTNLANAMSTARELYPDTDFVHASFESYFEALKNALPGKLSVVKGELRSQRTDGWSTLVNTASARVYLKQMNQRGQALLERTAEPLAAWAKRLGGQYPHHLFTYAWKTLMQNHPHDSICGCSVDEVHREMITRFDKSRHVAETIIDDSMYAIASTVDTSSLASYGDEALPFVVFNTTGWKRSGTVTIELDVVRMYFRDGIPLEEIMKRINALELGHREIIDAEGKSLACTLEDLGLQFGYDLPDDKFRQPYCSRRVKLTFGAEDVPALGLKAYALVKPNAQADKAAATEALKAVPSLLQGARVLENELLRVEIGDDGSLSILDKKSDRTYRDLAVYENTGDIGNEYMFKQPNGETALTTKGLLARITVIEDTPYRASVEIIHEWAVPASAGAILDREQHELVYFPERQAQRVKETVVLTIRTVVSLERSGQGVSLKATFNNKAKDHRVRMLFPTDVEAAVHYADSIFEIAKRDNEPAAEWMNPSNCQHQQAFADVSGATGGLTVANLGLNEYEVLRDGRNTIAVTLLRAVGELGDWGYFPTPEAQCLGENAAELFVIPHQGTEARFGAYAQAYQFQTPWSACAAELHAGSTAPVSSSIAWEGEGLAFSSMTIKESTGELMLRWFNMNSSKSELSLDTYNEKAVVRKSDLLDGDGGVISRSESGAFKLPVGKCEIVTLSVEQQA